MNILILTDYFPPDRIGGVGAIAHGLADAYRALGHKVFVLTTGESREDERQRGIVRGAGNLTCGVLTNNLRALHLIRRERISLVHLHQSATTLFLLARLVLRRFPFVLDSLQVSYLAEARAVRTVTVADRQLRPRFGEWVERFLLAPAHVLFDFIGFVFSDVVTTVSDDNHREIAGSYGRLTSRPLEVVPNGVPVERISGGDFRDTALEERLRGKVVVAYIGVFRARKRVANVLLAFGKIVERCPESVVLLVGGGRGYDEPLRALAAELGLADRVVFAGSVPAARVPYYLSLVDVFCLLSSYEGMPMAMLEAMQQGKAVVATDVYGMRDLLAAPGEEAGVLVPVDDIAATGRALETLVRDAERRRALGEAARKRVQSQFTWDRIARRYLALVNGA